MTTPIASADIQCLTALLESGRCLETYVASQRFGPLGEWRGSEARILAARIARAVGAPRLTKAHIVRAFREHPLELLVRYFYCQELLTLRGPWVALQFAERSPDIEASAVDRAHWLTVRATLAQNYRDFERARTFQSQAEELAPHDPWIRLARSYLLEEEDRRREALAVAETVLELSPGHRSAIEWRAHLLVQLGEDEEAAASLEQAARKVNAASIVHALANLQIELERFDAAWASIDRVVELSPLLETKERERIEDMRARIGLLKGDARLAIRHARASKIPFHLKAADRLEASSETRGPTILPVGFVRQHHMTCAPATLAALSHYWKVPADHCEIAEDICYDGTPCYDQRRWAVQNGWVTREFTVTEAAAAALIERGVPFTLATTEPESSHLQAVVGWDPRCGMIFMRDPSFRSLTFAFAAGFLSGYAAFGPRGMAIVPAERADSLAGLLLPEAEIWDLLHEIKLALRRHDRVAAIAALEAILAKAPDSSLAHHARWQLADYDDDRLTAIGCIEALLAQHPTNVHLRLARLSRLQGLRSRSEVLAEYAKACAEPEAHPLCLMRHANDLMEDEREADRAQALVDRALKRAPLMASLYESRASREWSRRNLRTSVELYRLAACLEPHSEALAGTYFRAAWWSGDPAAGLTFLERRCAEIGGRSSAPARTLHTAYLQLDRSGDAERALERALTLRPDDGDLLLYAARAAAAGHAADRAEAAKLLKRAEGKVARGEWLRVSADMAEREGELPAALAAWREIAERAPLDATAHQAVARLLAATEGRSAALQHLRAAVERFPHHRPLGVEWIEWLRDEPFDVKEPELRKFIALHENDAWGHRELGYDLVAAGRIAEAEGEAKLAVELEPGNAAGRHLQGAVAVAAGRHEDAIVCFRDAVRLDADFVSAIEDLLGACDGIAERRSELELVWERLLESVTRGGGLAAFCRRARELLDGDALEKRLRSMLDLRPDVWRAWSALAGELVRLARFDEAKALAQRAAERFPLRAELWCDLATACRALGEDEPTREALLRACAADSSNRSAILALTDFYQRHARYQEARDVLDCALRASPLDSVYHGYLADLEWQQGRRREALDELERALSLAPGYEWAWSCLSMWSSEAGEGERPVRVARELTRTRAGEARSWWLLARVLAGPAAMAERLAALDRALGLSPRFVEAWRLKARLLADSGRLVEALEACRPAAFRRPPPTLELQAAEIESMRGQRADAIGRLQALVRDHPHEVDAWRKLATWCAEAGDVAGALGAARALVGIAPLDETAHAHLGNALLAANQRAGARAAFERAIQLDPTYEFAVNALFDLLFADRDYEAAKRTLDAFRARRPDSPFIDARLVQVCCASSEFARTLSTYERLLQSREWEEWPLKAATEAADAARLDAQVDSLLLAAATRTDAPPAVRAFFAQREVARGRARSCFRLVKEWCDAGAGAEALRAFTGALAERQSRFRRRMFVFRHRKWLRQTTLAWAYGGYVLSTSDAFRATARWHSDWPKRADVHSWMLCNLAKALRMLGRETEALAINAAGADLPREECSGHHDIWLATDALLKGDPHPARHCLQNTSRPRLEKEYQFLCSVMEILAKVLELPRAQQPPAAVDARLRILRLMRPKPRFDGRRIYIRFAVRALGHLARLRGSRLARLRHVLWDAVTIPR
jgi:cellulose synthase operon protein C